MTIEFTMKFLFKQISVIFILFFSAASLATSLAEDAQNRGINETCSNYLEQIESSYGLNGLNITFAHPESPSLLPSLHISSQKYNNGSSSFSATLMPDDEYCYLSTVLVTAINNQSCSEISQIKSENDQNLNVSVYGDGNYTILTPSDGSFQAILTSSGDNSCTMTETRMMWPGK
jgi:hypothetical protein